MAATTAKTYCITCEKGKITYKCEGCSKYFCFDDLASHRQLLIKQLDDLENERNLFRQTLFEQSNHPYNLSLIQQIDQWEEDSIKKIQQMANDTKQSLLKHIGEFINQVEVKLSKLTEELKQVREENDVNEIHLDRFKQNLKALEERLNKPSNISIHQENSSGFINKITVSIKSIVPHIGINTKWVQNGITVVGGNGEGNEMNQLVNPLNVYVDDDETIYMADHRNHRIVEWKKGAGVGRIIAGGNGKGDRNDQLNFPRNVILDKKNDSLIICDAGNNRVVRWPRRCGTSGETVILNIDCWGLAMDNDGYLYVSDISKDEVRRWKIGETNGTLIAGGNGKGNHPNQLNEPRYIFLDEDHAVYVSDCYNNRVMKWMKGAKEGLIVAGGQGQGQSMTQLLYPHGILVDQLGTVYVADFGNHRVLRWPKGANQGSIVVGGNLAGGQENQFNYLTDLSFDEQYNLYVADFKNNRVQKFSIDNDRINH